MITLTERLFPQPTLALYLGGSGILVGSRLLSLMESLDADDRAMIEPFFIDSQEPAITDHARARHYCYENLYQFYEPLYQYFTDHRFPRNIGASPVINSSEGCGVTRIFGTASLVACRDDFANLIEQASGRLRRTRRASTQPLQIFLTASACGGTGAGMIIDAAALVRHFFRERGENPRIFMFLIGPKVYLEDPTISLREDQRSRMRASSYALLKELHHFAQGKPFLSAYRLRDRPIEIGNVSDDDRLFEWVYYIDGRGEQTGAARTLAETTWMIAETQLHLSATEVGRKVAESMPNQREERLREFAVNFVHPDNKDRLSPASHERLRISGRRTFLASFAVRNVRFPSDEIKTWFRWGWVREALEKSLTRNAANDDRPLVDQFDHLLGFDGKETRNDGLLADLGLTREQLSARVTKEAAQDQALRKPISPALHPDAAINTIQELLTITDWVIADMKRDSSLLTGGAGAANEGPLMSYAEVLRRAFPRWTEFWTQGLAANGKIAERLWEIACDPATGRGLRFLDQFLVHTAELLTRMAAEGKQQPSLDGLETALDEFRQSFRGMERMRDHERKSLLFRLFSIFRRQAKYSDKLLKKTASVLKQANILRQSLLDARSARIAGSLAPAAWLKSAQQIKRWRDDVLAPAMIAAENAWTLADNRWQLARQALSSHQGANRHGRWTALSTVQIADEELLEALTNTIRDRVFVEDIVLAPLHGEGISRERHRVTFRTLHDIDRETTVETLGAHVTDHTRGALTFLDNGWMLEDVRRRLNTSAARALDVGAEPLASFSRTAVGQPLQSYLLTPSSLILPVPFGRRLERMNRLGTRDSLQLGVVSFVFGIPPNLLDDMGELFEEYRAHIGDQLDDKAHDRYPLHAFRDASIEFDEPYSPLSIQIDDRIVQSLVNAAKTLFGSNGSGIKLDLRSFDADSSTDREDWNRIVELTEKILGHLRRFPLAADKLFRNGEHPELARLYFWRKHRLADALNVTESAADPPGEDSEPVADA